VVGYRSSRKDRVLGWERKLSRRREKALRTDNNSDVALAPNCYE
jgi:hypothetical protein